MIVLKQLMIVKQQFVIVLQRFIIVFLPFMIVIKNFKIILQYCCLLFQSFSQYSINFSCTNYFYWIILSFQFLTKQEVITWKNI